MDYQKAGRLLKELRTNGGYTQEEFGEMIGKSKSTIQKYEKGLVEIPDKVFVKIASVTGVYIPEAISPPVSMAGMFIPEGVKLRGVEGMSTTITKLRLMNSLLLLAGFVDYIDKDPEASKACGAAQTKDALDCAITVMYHFLNTTFMEGGEDEGDLQELRELQADVQELLLRQGPEEKEDQAAGHL